MQATELLNQDDPRPTEVSSDLDRPHAISMSGIWELPFGRDRSFLTGGNAFALGLVGGWQMQGIYIYQSGPPIGWGNIIFNGDIRNIGLPGDEQSVNRWINTMPDSSRRRRRSSPATSAPSR